MTAPKVIPFGNYMLSLFKSPLVPKGELFLLQSQEDPEVDPLDMQISIGPMIAGPCETAMKVMEVFVVEPRRED